MSRKSISNRRSCRNRSFGSSGIQIFFKDSEDLKDAGDLKDADDSEYFEYPKSK